MLDSHNSKYIYLDEDLVLLDLKTKKEMKKTFEKYLKIFNNKKIKEFNGIKAYEFPYLKEYFYNGYFFNENHIKCYNYFKEQFYSDEEIAEMFNIPVEFLKEITKNSLFYSKKTKKVGLIRNVIEE